MIPKRVYIAGPYTGDEAANVRAAIEAAEFVRNAGHVPFVPHLMHFWGLQHPRPYGDWLAQCLVWLACCEAVLRLPGHSAGADVEVATAAKLGIPVFHAPLDLIHAYRESRR